MAVRSANVASGEAINIMEWEISVIARIMLFETVLTKL